MKKNLYRLITFSTLTLTLSACSFFDKDNTPTPAPLVNFTPTASLHAVWHTRAGAGTGGDFVRLSPAFANNTLFTSSSNGTLTAVDAATGHIRWQKQTDLTLTSGVAANKTEVFVGSQNGTLVALDQTTGKLLWQARANSEILATPAANDNTVLVKSIDGSLAAFSASGGQPEWTENERVPDLILRGDSAVRITNDAGFAGFASGTFARFNLHTGHATWSTAVTQPSGIFPIQRMIDIDADPIVVGNHVYVTTWQGRIASINAGNGNILWSHAMSSFAGIALSDNALYAAAADSHLYAFNAVSGKVTWQQNALYARTITGPAVCGNYVVVGDAEGWLHVLNRENGQFAARVQAGSASGIYAAPIVNGRTIYTYANNGELSAWTLN